MRDARLRTFHAILPCNNRGAVFLLSVYVTALVLLVLSGLSLQRTTHEQRMAIISRDSQQAFWLAEAGMDQAIQRIRQSPMNVNTTTPFSSLSSTGTLTVTIVQSLTAPTWIQPIP